MYIPLTFEGALQSCLYAVGGNDQGFFLSGSDQYAFHIFSQTGSGQTLSVLAGTLNNVQIAVVGGGGGGAVSLLNGAGGGGGGVIISPNNILYAGTYTINVGSGGSGGVYNPGIDNPGQTGNPSSISGQNLYLSVDGGYGGNGNVGGNSGAPTSFSGSAGTSTRGGGGAGAGGASIRIIPTQYGVPGPGISASFGGQPAGAYPSGFTLFSAGGYGHNWTATDPTGSQQGQFGTGGDGSNRNSGNPGQNGRNGAVIIQYKINNYCKNWFNQTGSCNCSQITFNIPQSGQTYFDLTGSYAYTQCGTNTFVSGNVISNFPVTVCTASGSWYSFISSDPNGAQQNNSAFSSGNNCFSASYGVQTCVTQSFPPTNCGSNLFYSSSSSGIVYYVPTGSANILQFPVSASRIGYVCASSGSTPLGYYPSGMLGTLNFVSSSIVNWCRNYLFTPVGIPQTATYYSCDTNQLQTSVISSPTTFCCRVNRPRTLSGAGASITDTGAGCFPGGTGSCNCP